jgi:uncharacterized protein (DUF58 family)
MSTARHRGGSSTRFPHPTRAAALLLVIATILELLGRLIHSTGVTVAAAAALGAVIGDAALSPRIAGLKVSRTGPDRLALAVPSTVALTIMSPSGRGGGRRSIVLIDRHPALSTARVVTPSLRAASRASATYRVVPELRGRWEDAGEIVVEAFSPLGGFVRRRHVPVTGELLVHPAPAVPYRLPDIAAGVATGATLSPRSGVGTDFYGIREWRSGDAASAVHWRASARRNRLVVTERERPASSALVIGCDRPAPAAVWEPALGRCAATAVAALRAGRKVVLVAQHGTTAPTTARDVLDWFADVGPVPLEDRGRLPAALKDAGGGATLLWLSDRAGTEIAATARHAGATAVVAPLSESGAFR